MGHFKACPRCLGGDLIRDPESKFGPDVYWFQCGCLPSRSKEFHQRFDVHFDLSDGPRILLHKMSPLPYKLEIAETSAGRAVD
jgi:hypothetical protein